MSGKAVVAIHGDGNLSNYLARLSISKVIYSASSFIHSACFPAFHQFCSSCGHTPRFIDLLSEAGNKIKFSAQSPDIPTLAHGCIRHFPLDMHPLGAAPLSSHLPKDFLRCGSTRSSSHCLGFLLVILFKISNITNLIPRHKKRTSNPFFFSYIHILETEKDANFM